MEHDAWFFISIFVFIFLVWAATGGPLHPLSFAGPTLAQPEELGGGTYLQLPRVPFTVGNANIVLPGSSAGSGAGGAAVPPPLYGFAFGTPSPYRDIVRLNHYVSNASSSNPESEYVELSIAQNAGTPVDLTGWKLESLASFKKATFPGGAAVPTSGDVNPTEDIVLMPGERAIIISGESPIGASFRENKCIGYLADFQTFYPSLPENCPDASDELETYYGRRYIHDPICVDYVRTLSRCETSQDEPDNLPNACIGFLDRYINYNGCVKAHRTDANFHGDTWRIYLGREKLPLWRARHELIKLYDAQGRTVDAFTY